MSDDSLTRASRDALVRRIRELEARLYPPPTDVQPNERERELAREAYYVALAEYFDRLPRVLMSVCPFTGDPVRRAIDPWGLDGFWWHQRPLGRIEEPASPDTFRTLLGSLALGGRKPSEAVEPVLPGPEVPFVVPRLLQLPGMVAVLHRLTLDSGDVAHTIGYFSSEEIPSDFLHQHWLRADLWFKDDEGDTSWLIANDAWDFELAPYVAAGTLRWVEDTPDGPVVRGAADGPCPYLAVPGERRPQFVCNGEREFTELPSGEPFEPFADS